MTKNSFLSGFHKSQLLIEDYKRNLHDEAKNISKIQERPVSLDVYWRKHRRVFCCDYPVAKLDYASVDHFWRVSAKDGLIAACMPLVTIVLNGVLGDMAKARSLFSGVGKTRSPGCRSFTVLMHTDPRIDVSQFEGKTWFATEVSKRSNTSLVSRCIKDAHQSLLVSEGHRLLLAD